MVPLFLPIVLLFAQAFALVAAVRHGIWRLLPGWAAYVAVATVHLIAGMTMSLIPGYGYPVVLLYFEPVLIICQIVLTFEVCLKVLRVSPRGGPPESRLMLWLIPLVPAAIVLPIEIGFIRDAVEKWNRFQGDSLMLVYGVRRFLSITLLIVLAVVPLIAGLARKKQQKAVVFHHRILTAYFLCSSIGYLWKSYVSVNHDLAVTIAFFIVAPMLCFVAWAMRMWNCPPADIELVEPAPQPENSSAFAARSAIEHL